MAPKHRMPLVGMKEFVQWLWRLFQQPLFLFVTAWGHISILAGALLFRYFEQEINPKLGSFFEAYYWAISTAMTVGSSDVVPHTTGGRVVAIFLMMIGSLFLWSYAALFAASVMLPTVRHFDQEVQEMEKELALDQKTLRRLAKAIEELQKGEENARRGL